MDEVESPKRRAVRTPAAQLVAWLELFYDLVFVAAILVLSSAVSHLHQPGRVAWVVAVFASLWWIWLQTTLFTNRYQFDDMTHRILVLIQMFLVILVAMEATEGVVRDGAYLSLTYAALLATVVLMYARAARARVPGTAYATRRAYYLGASAALFLVAAAVPGVRGVVWAVAIAVGAGPLGTRDDVPALDEHHLFERMGAFTIIVCGEAFVKVAIAVSIGTVEDVDVISLAFEFILVFAIWLAYFQDIPFAGLRPNRLTGWLACHLVLQIGIAGTAIGVARLVKAEPFDHLPAEEILEITATLASVYLALALLGLCTRRAPARPEFVLRLSTCVATVVVGTVAWAIPWVDLVEGVAALTVVAVVHAALSVRLTRRTRVLDQV
jgi:low temperature requirement protein LtrA